VNGLVGKFTHLAAVAVDYSMRCCIHKIKPFYRFIFNLHITG
jgi:hypothetical protein